MSDSAREGATGRVMFQNFLQIPKKFLYLHEPTDNNHALSRKGSEDNYKDP